MHKKLGDRGLKHMDVGGGVIGEMKKQKMMVSIWDILSWW